MKLKEHQIKVHDFFEKYGERVQKFRKKVFLKFLQKKNTIISTGAGILNNDEIILKLRKRVLVFFRY